MFVEAFQRRAFLAAGGIGFMAAVAVIVVHATAGSLLGIQAEFLVGLAALVAGGKERDSDEEQAHHGDTETRREA
jgi:hypothetical protein